MTPLQAVLERYLSEGRVRPDEWAAMCEAAGLASKARKGALVGVDAQGAVKAAYVPPWTPRGQREGKL